MIRNVARKTNARKQWMNKESSVKTSTTTKKATKQNIASNQCASMMSIYVYAVGLQTKKNYARFSLYDIRYFDVCLYMSLCIPSEKCKIVSLAVLFVLNIFLRRCWIFETKKLNFRLFLFLSLRSIWNFDTKSIAISLMLLLLLLLLDGVQKKRLI